jgi:hypothetical protein
MVSKCYFWAQSTTEIRHENNTIFTTICRGDTDQNRPFPMPRGLPLYHKTPEMNHFPYAASFEWGWYLRQRTISISIFHLHLHWHCLVKTWYAGCPEIRNLEARFGVQCGPTNGLTINGWRKKYVRIIQIHNFFSRHSDGNCCDVNTLCTLV